MNAEQLRLIAAARREQYWRRWGPYLSEREWGTVREDYSADGRAWEYFPFEHSHLRAYRWGEDGIAGICDNHQRLCFALAFWNGRDPILKERLFGLTGNQGNHGEDVKECYYYLDSTPTHSYMKCLYKYPQAEFPYARLLEAKPAARAQDPEFELIDTGVFDRGPLLRRLRRVRQGGRQRHPDPHHGDQPRAGCRAAAPAADPVVPQYLDLGSERAEAVCYVAGERRRSIEISRTDLGAYQLDAGRASAAAVHRKRNQYQGAVELGLANAQPLREGCVSSARDPWPARRR